MSPGLPFDELLSDLRDAGLVIGAEERLSLARLLSRYDGTSREELRNAIAGLLARNAEEVDLIREAFDRRYPAGSLPPGAAPKKAVAEAPPAAEARSASPKPSRLRAWLALAALSPLLIALWLFGISSFPLHTAPNDPPISKLPQSLGAGIDGGGTLLEGAPERPAGCPPRADAAVDRWPLPSLLLALAASATLAGLGWLHYRRRLIAWTRRLLRRRLAELPGPRTYAAADAAPAARAGMDDLIAILEAALGEAGPRRLDVDRSVDRTARAGLLPIFVYRTRTRSRRVVLLRDIGYESAPWRSKLDAFERTLERRGVFVDRFLFDRDPSRVTAGPTAPWVPLDSLAPERKGLPLVVLGTGDALVGGEGAHRVREALAPWPARVLLTPVEDPELWPEGLLDPGATIAVFSMDAGGLLDATEHLSALRRHESGRPRLRATVRPPIQPDEVRRLRGMLALAPAPSFELAELLRRRFLPHAPDEIVLSVEPLVREASLGLHDKAAEALAWLRVDDPDRQTELEVRRFLVADLEQRRPADTTSAAFLRWRADMLIQRLHLAADEGELREVCRELGELAATPLRADLQGRLAQEIEDARRLEVPQSRIAAVRALASDLGAPRRKDVRELGARPLLLPSGRGVAAVIAATALVAACLDGLHIFDPRKPDLDGSTNLLWSRGDLRMALCAFDDFYAVDASSDAIVGLAIIVDPERPADSMGQPNPKGEAPVRGSVVAFRIAELGPLRTLTGMKLTDLTISGERKGALFRRTDTDLDVFAAGRDEGTIYTLRLDSLELIGAVPLFKGKTWGFAPHFNDQGRLLHYSPEDGARVVGDELQGETSLRSARVERDLSLWRRSQGIMPGTSGEVIARIVNRAPSAGACPPPLQFCEPYPTAPTAPWGGDVCVDIETDPENCGECHRTCRKDQECTAGRCACRPGTEECDGRCVDTRSDDANCGGCGTRCEDGACNNGSCSPALATSASPFASASPLNCPMGMTQCGKACVDLRRDPLNCGACGQSCLRQGLSYHCGLGRCEVCVEGYATCRPDDKRGCRTQVISNVEHCGKCGNRCPAFPNANPVCADRTCGITCQPGFQNCDGLKTNGCEANTSTSSQHCGKCGNSCGKTGVCAAGVCRDQPD